MKNDTACSIDGCERPARARGLCTAHYYRQRRTGSPGGSTIRPKAPTAKGASHHLWRGDNAGYLAAHLRVVATRGKASDHFCVDCGQGAHQWSYDHTELSPKTATVNGSVVEYSLDIERYQPRCLTCHKGFDTGRARKISVT